MTDVEVLVGALDIDTGSGRAALDRIGVTAERVFWALTSEAPPPEPDTTQSSTS